MSARRTTMQAKQMSPKVKVFISYLAIVIASFVFALSTYMFLVPAKLIPGGVTGFASMIQIVTGFPAQYSILIINIPILICALIFTDKKVAIRSIFGILCITGWMQLFSTLNFYRFDGAGDAAVTTMIPVVSAVVSGFLTGVSVGVLLNVDASSGGTELTSMMLQKKLKEVKVSNIIFVINITIVIINALVYYFTKTFDLENIILLLVCSIIQNLINSKGVDMILNGFNSAVKFEIVTKKHQELCKAILKESEYGVTIIDSKGAYFDENNKMLICIVPKLKIPNFKAIINEIDPDAFVFSINTREVMGRNFKRNR